jgi:hypothetical protein
MDRRLGEPQSQPGRGGKDKKKIWGEKKLHLKNMYYLFYDAVSSSDFAYITWNDRINKK